MGETVNKGGASVGRETNEGSGARLHTRIADILAAEITQSTHPAGRHLVETQLAERFGVSRTTIRLALARLSEDGFLDHAQGRGHVVRAALPAGEPPDASAFPRVGEAEIGARHAWESIYDEVEDAITARISSGSWQVPETALARHFGVSRTVARDVLARLQGKGLVRMDGGRWVAPALTRQRVDELYRLRAILEPEALRETAGRLPIGVVRAARDRLEVAQRSAPDGAVLNSLEHELHVDLLSHCGNATLLDAIRQPQALLIAHRFLYERTEGLFGPEPFIVEHLAVLEALAAGDVARAADLMRDHLMVSRARAIERIDTVRGSTDSVEISYLRPTGTLADP